MTILTISATKLILHGTTLVVLLITALLLTYDTLTTSQWLRLHVQIASVAVLYLAGTEILFQHNFKYIVTILLLVFYELLAFYLLLTMGINSPFGVLAISFATTLPSILVGSRAIIPSTSAAVFVLVFVQLYHTNLLPLVDIDSNVPPSTFSDVALFSTVIAILALVSWVSSHQRETALKKALDAEQALSTQKDTLRKELESESAALRQSQLNQIHELHRFAFLGQTAAATLHDLSSHLIILNIDIDDLLQYNKNSRAIANAKESIAYINKMVREAKRQLHSYGQPETFDVIHVIERTINDIRHKFKQHHVKLNQQNSKELRGFTVSGNKMAFMQIVTILVNNAIEACHNLPNPKVTILIKHSTDGLRISIIDTGPGIQVSSRDTLFTPGTSSKPTGMGIGLYIAQHLAKSQFDGNIKYNPSRRGAHFTIHLPDIARSGVQQRKVLMASNVS